MHSAWYSGSKASFSLLSGPAYPSPEIVSNNITSIFQPPPVRYVINMLFVCYLFHVTNIIITNPALEVT
jgi:hypothetical protein